MRVLKKYRNASLNTRALIIRSLIRLCVGFVLWSTVPVAAQSTDMDVAQSAPESAIPAASPTPTPAPLPAPLLLSPAHEAETTVVSNPPLGLPTFSWEAVAGADSYEIQLSDDPSFGVLLPSGRAIETYALSHTLLKSLPDDEYYWRVRACIARPKTCYEYSETRFFRKDWTAQGGAVPQLISPPQDSIRIRFAEDDFSWTPVIGAARYMLELSADAGFATSSIVYSAESLVTRHTPFQKKLENNVYYWRVTPIDNQGNRGTASAVGKFELNWSVTPQLLVPNNGAVLQFSPRFQWTAVEGARMYQLQVSTDENFGTVLGSGVNLPNTSANFRENLPNDQEFFWRVKGTDYWGKSTPWSEVRSFRMKWNFEAKLLAPPNDANSPGIKLSHFYLTWTPIPGAERYQVQVDESDYTRPLVDEMFYNVNSAMLYKPRETTILLDQTYTWRVRGFDAQGNVTPWSDEFPFQMGQNEVSPNLIYPPFYFEPDSVTMPQYRDNTVAWPFFVWDSAFCNTIIGKSDNVVRPCPPSGPLFYELTVSSDITFQTNNFTIRTRNNAAAPTLQDQFQDLQDGHIYFWRVRAFVADPSDPTHAPVKIGEDAVWQAKIDRTYPQVVKTDQVTLIYPRNGFEAVGTAPVLGWQPVNGAASYEVVIAKDSAFQNIIDQADAQFINYVPWQAHTNDANQWDDMPFGAYYWRVRAKDNAGTPIGNWSETRNFNLSKDIITGNPYDVVPPPFEYPVTTNLVTGTRHSIFESSGYESYTYMASSENSFTNDYALGKLHLMLNRVALSYPQVGFDDQEWIIAFGVSESVTAPVYYGLYVDIDHVEGSGGASDPKGYDVPISSRYRPEYVFYVERQPNGDFQLDANDVTYYSWDEAHNVWLPGPQDKTTLASLSGRAWYVSPVISSSISSVIQLVIPYEKMGIADTQSTGSLALTVFSLDFNTKKVVDTIPHQDGIFDNPLFVSDMPMPLYPFDTPLSNPIVYDDMPTFRWRMPYFDSVDGYQVEIARDPKFTDRVDLWEISESGTNSLWSWLPHDFQSIKAYEDNESLYFRVRMRNERFQINASSFDYSPWSPYIRIKLGSRRAGNLQISTDSPAWMTPTFTWDRVDGASGYTLQVDNDANFTSPVINEKVDVPSFTPLEMLSDGTYYWRVMTRRSKTLQGAPSEVMTFTMRLSVPTPISPINDVEVSGMPTFRWQPILTPGDIPRQSASRYKIELSSDAGFSKPMIVYSEATTYTPLWTTSLPAGTWYWRVGVLDFNNNEGSLSAIQSFKISYPTVALLGPSQGDQFNEIPEFSWEPLEGAAYYELWIDTDPGFTRATKVKTDNSRFTPTTQFAAGTYYWQVRMYNDRDVPGGFQQGEFVIRGNTVYLPLVSK